MSQDPHTKLPLNDYDSVSSLEPVSKPEHHPISLAVANAEANALVKRSYRKGWEIA